MKIRIFTFSLILIFLFVFLIFYKGLQNSNIYKPNANIEMNIPNFEAKLLLNNKVISSKEIFKDDDFFLIAPATSSSFSTELHYKAKPVQLSSSNANTWLSDNAESALLYGTLVEAYTYLKGEQDIMAFYEKRYKEALGSLTQYGAIETNVDSYRNGMRQTA